MNFMKNQKTELFGNILSELRKSRGLTQKQLSEIFNISISTLEHYEQGVTPPNFFLLSDFADFFKFLLIT